jgi:hypothetical protein
MSQATRDHWVNHSIPAAVIEQMSVFEAQWGDWLLPPAPRYNGGPELFRSDMPQADVGGGWWFEAGDERFSMWYWFLVGPTGEFGIGDGVRRVPLHASVAGWVEAVALAYQAQLWAPRIETVRGAAVGDLDLSDMEPFNEVAGVSDGWWRDAHTVIVVYRGEAQLSGDPGQQAATHLQRYLRASVSNLMAPDCVVTCLERGSGRSVSEERRYSNASAGPDPVRFREAPGCRRA